MRQTAVELPDPLDAQASTATDNTLHGGGGPANADAAPSNPAGVDDLISQMAGDEIDRLLAEAERENPEATSAQVSVAVAESMDRESRAITEALEPTASDSIANGVQSAAATDSRPATQTPAPFSSSPVTLESTVTASTTESSSRNEPPAVVAIDAAATTPEERAALEAPMDEPVPSSDPERASLLSTDTTVTEAEDATGAADSSADEGPLPIWLRPLEWLSAPLAGASPGVRNAIGKIAILTSANAAGILLYVMIFRRH